jgi:hypothetical protein
MTLCLILKNSFFFFQEQNGFFLNVKNEINSPQKELKNKTKNNIE